MTNEEYKEFVTWLNSPVGLLVCAEIGFLIAVAGIGITALWKKLWRRI